MKKESPLVNSGIDVQTLDGEDREEHLVQSTAVVSVNDQDYKYRPSVH